MKEEKMCDYGIDIYYNFCDKLLFIPVKIMTPNTQILRKFYILDKLNQTELLLREMMKEFISNLDKSELCMDRNNIYRIENNFIKIKKWKNKIGKSDF